MIKVKIMVMALVMSASLAFPAFAGQWQQDTKGYWYQNDDGSYPVNQWQQVDGKQYYFGNDGYMYVNTTTPDGYQVGADGSWTQDGAVQKRNAGLAAVTSTPATAISEGIYKVGTDIAAGEYVLLSNASYGGYCSVNADSTGSIIFNALFDYNYIVTVQNGQYLEFNDSTLSPLAEVPQIDYTKGTMFKVGYHIPAGEYKLQSDPEYSGYYAVLTSSQGGFEAIITNNIFDGQAYVTVSEGQYLELSNCSIIQ